MTGYQPWGSNLTRHEGLKPGGGLAPGSLGRGTGLSGGGLLARTRIRPVSKKRTRENRERHAVVEELWPERPKCFVPWCHLLADDVHEAKSRARGGKITDRRILRPLCRGHHDEVTFRPESELGWAYELQILFHSWDELPAGDAA